MTFLHKASLIKLSSLVSKQEHYVHKQGCQPQLLLSETGVYVQVLCFRLEIVVTEDLTTPGSSQKHPPLLPGSPCRVVQSLNKQSWGSLKSGWAQAQQRSAARCRSCCAGPSAPNLGCVARQHFCCKT